MVPRPELTFRATLLRGGDEIIELAVERVVRHQLTDRAAAGADIGQDGGQLLDPFGRLRGDVGERTDSGPRLHVSPLGNRRTAALQP